MSTRRRLAAPDPLRSVQSWRDRAVEYAGANNLHTTISVRTFMAAGVAAGDIPFAPVDRTPFHLAVGITDVGNEGRDSAAWRKVLGGRMLDPNEQPKRQERPGDARYGWTR
jgi:hypothetical protein